MPPPVQVFAHPSSSDEGTILVQIDTPKGGRFKIMLNDGCLFRGDVEENPEEPDFDAIARQLCDTWNFIQGAEADLIELLRAAARAGYAAAHITEGN